MSKKRNRAKLNKAKTSRVYNLIMFRELYPPYYEEGIMFYPKYRAGFKNTNRRLPKCKIREYRTWKHNRKTQYKT
jgi:hypothetical protein